MQIFNSAMLDGREQALAQCESHLPQMGAKKSPQRRGTGSVGCIQVKTLI